jgi:hypothetical protein
MKVLPNDECISFISLNYMSRPYHACFIPPPPPSSPHSVQRVLYSVAPWLPSQQNVHCAALTLFVYYTGNYKYEEHTLRTYDEDYLSK